MPSEPCPGSWPLHCRHLRSAVVLLRRCWQGISHPMNSNPFPASFLNFKASLRLIPVTVPGGQTLVEWTMDLLTETHAVEYMAESMNGIMRVGLLSEYCCPQCSCR